MLSNEVCVRCWERGNWGQDSTGYYNWINNLVYCPSYVVGLDKNSRSQHTFADKAPPKWCPHKFEHAVAHSMPKTSETPPEAGTS